MPGGNSYTISKEFKGLLGQHLEFYESVLDLYETTELRFLASAADSRLETEVQDNGDLQVKLIIALDDNEDPDDGRIYLEDVFTLDPKQNAFKKYRRQFSVDGELSKTHPFYQFKNQYEATAVPDVAQARAFANSVLVARPRPLTMAWQESFANSPLQQALQKELQALAPGFAFRWDHPRTSLAVATRDEKTTLVFKLAAVREPEDGAEEIVFFNEKFRLDDASGSLVAYAQSWTLPRQQADDGGLSQVISQLNADLSFSTDEGAEQLLLRSPFWSAISAKLSANPGAKSALKAHMKDYVLPLVGLAQSLDSDWALKTKDPLSSLQVWQQGDRQQLVLSLVFAGSDAEASTKIVVRDHFFLDAAGDLVDHQRRWSLPEGVESNKALQKKMRKLRAKAAPDLSGLQAFVGDLSSLAPAPQALVKVPELSLAAAKEKILEQAPALSTTWSLAAKVRGPEVSEKNHQHVLAALEIVGVFAQEQALKQDDAAKAWFSGEVEPASGVDRMFISTLLNKAAAHSKTHPSLGLLQVLQSAPLSESESKYIRSLTRHRVLQRLSSAVSESSDGFRNRSLMQLASKDLWDGEWTATAHALAGQLQGQPVVAQRAGQLLALIEGNGDWKTKSEYVAPKVFAELGDPWMLAGMMAAPFAGVAVEAAALPRQVGKINRTRRYLAMGAGIFAEATAFTTISDIGQSLHHDPGQVWSGFLGQTASTSLMFGLLRGGHHFSGRLSAKMAEGELGAYWGGNKAAAPYYPSTASERVLLGPTPAYLELTRPGQIISGTAQHGSGIAAMYTANLLSAAWMPHLPAHDWRGGIFDAALSYAHAHAGFRLANGISGGGLQSNLARYRLGLKEYDVQFEKSLDQEVKEVPGRVKESLKTSYQAWSQRFLDESTEDATELPEALSFDLLLEQVSPGARLPRESLKLEFGLAAESGEYQFRALKSKDDATKDPASQDPRWLAILHSLRGLSFKAPELKIVATEAKESGEGSLQDAVKILQEIATEFAADPENVERLEEKFQTAHQILELAAQRTKGSEELDPRYMALVEQFRNVATMLGIEAEPPKDMVEKIARQLKKLTDQISQSAGPANEVMADPNPGETGEFLGALKGPDGYINIRLDGQSQQLLDANGNPVAEVWAGEHEGSLFIAVQTLAGDAIMVDGKPLSENFIYPEQHPSFQIVGRNYRFSNPTRNEEVLGSAEAQGLAARHDIDTPEYGYEAWRVAADSMAGLAILDAIPPEQIKTKQAWVTFLLSRDDDSTRNCGTTNFLRRPKIIIGSNQTPGSVEDPLENFSGIVEAGIFAPEQALVFLDQHYYLNIVRLATENPQQTVYVNGVEIRSEYPTRLKPGSRVELQGADGHRYPLDMELSNILVAKQPANARSNLDTQARIEVALDEPEDTGISSPNVQRVASTDSLEAGPSRREDTLFGVQISEVRDVTIVGPEPKSTVFSQAFGESDPVLETQAPDFTSYSARDSENFHVEVSEDAAAAMKPSELPDPPSFGTTSHDESGEAPLEGPGRFSLGEESNAIPSVESPALPSSEAHSFGPELDPLRRLYREVFDGEDPLAGAEVIKPKPGEPIQQVMVGGAVQSVEVIALKISEQIRARNQLAEGGKESSEIEEVEADYIDPFASGMEADIEETSTKVVPRLDPTVPDPIVDEDAETNVVPRSQITPSARMVELAAELGWKNHPDLLAILNGEQKEFLPAFARLKRELNVFAGRALNPKGAKVTGRVNDGLGIIAQLREWHEQQGHDANMPDPEVVLVELERRMIELQNYATQDFTVISDGAQMKVSTFLTGETASVGGVIGKPVGMLMFGIRGDQDPAEMLQSVFALLQQAQGPIEVSFPIHYSREGVQYIGIKYADEHIGEVWDLTQKMVSAHPELFKEERPFLSDPVQVSKETLAPLGHVRLDEQTGEPPMVEFRAMLKLAKDRAKQSIVVGETSAHAVQRELKVLLEAQGWI